MAAFSLLRLPILQFENIIKMMKRLEVIRLSMCNKKIRRIIGRDNRFINLHEAFYDFDDGLSCVEFFELLHINLKNITTFIERSGFKMQISVGSCFEIIIFEYDSDYYTFRLENIEKRNEYDGNEINLKLGSTIVRSVYKNKDTLITFWDNTLDGLKTFASYFMDTLNFKIHTFDAQGGNQPNYSEELNTIVNWMNSRQPTIQECILQSIGRMSHDDYIFVLENINATEFRLIFEGVEEIVQTRMLNSETLVVFNSSWFTLHNLFMTNCSEYSLWQSNLTNIELQCFLYNWMKGEFPGLKSFCVYQNNNDINLSKVLGNLSVTGPVDKGGRIYNISTSKPYPIYWATDIHRQDGVSASIMCRSSLNTETKYFHFFVWPDLYGNNL